MALMMNKILTCPNCNERYFEKREYTSIEIDSITNEKMALQKQTGYYCINCNKKVAEIKDVVE